MGTFGKGPGDEGSFSNPVPQYHSPPKNRYLRQMNSPPVCAMMVWIK